MNLDELADGTAAVHRLAAFADGTSWSDVPADVQAVVLDHLTDTVGCIVGSAEQETVALVRQSGQVEQGLPSGSGALASAVGMPSPVRAGAAAFLNGIAARCNEFDDMGMPDLHPSGVIVPAALAAGEAAGRCGADVLGAIAVGLELLLRIGRAGYDEQHRSSGFLVRGLDASAVCGTVAAAAVGAKLAGLPARSIAHAMGIALSLAGGSLEANRSGGDVKQLQSGWAARSGLEAAGLAAVGITGPERVFEGGYGFYSCFAGGNLDPAMLADDLENRWECRSLRFKPYPSNYYTHTGIDAAVAARQQGVRPADVVAIRQLVAAPMLRTMGAPLAEKQHPATGYAARFSGPYTVAAALLGGGGGLGLGLDDFTDERTGRPEVLDLAARVTVHADPECDAVFPDQAPCVLEIGTSDGGLHRQEVWTNRGSPQRPLTAAELSAKFLDLARRSLPEPAAEQLHRAAHGLADAPALDRLTGALRSAKSVVE